MAGPHRVDPAACRGRLIDAGVARALVARVGVARIGVARIGVARFGLAALLSCGGVLLGACSSGHASTSTGAAHRPPSSSAHCPGGPTTTSAPSTTTTTSAAATTTTSVPTTTVSVPLVACPTSYGVGPSSTPTPPSTVTVAVPSSLAADVAVYTDAQGEMRLLGPEGWSCQALLATDGSSSVQVYAPGEPAPESAPESATEVIRTGQALVASQTGGCAGCAMTQARPLFPAAAQTATSAGEPCTTTRPPAETVDRLRSTDVAFADPPGVVGDGVPSGGPYTANGVMTYYGDSGQLPSYLATCTLPDSHHDLCTASLNLFLSDYGAK